MSMNRLAIFLVILISAGCGNGTKVPDIGSPNSVSTISTQTLAASMSATGTGTPGTWTITKAGKIVIPQPANFTVQQDSAETWQVNLTTTNSTLSQSCNFVHNAGSAVVSAGTGCSVSTSYMAVSVGDVVTLTIGSTVTQTATVGITLNETN